jgi:hypothetical protein
MKFRLELALLRHPDSCQVPGEQAAAVFRRGFSDSRQ